MKIVHLANFRKPLMMKADISDAFRRIGHEVVELQDDEVDVRELKSAVRDLGVRLFVWTRTYHHRPKGDMESFIERCRDVEHVPTVGIDMDLHWGIAERQKQIGRHPFWKLDTVYTPDMQNDEAFRSRGVNHRWMPPAVGDRWVGRGTQRDYLAKPVVFVGVKYHFEEWGYRKQLVEWLESKYQGQFARYGGSSKYGHIRGDALNDLCASAGVIVGDSMYRGDYYWSDRLPVILGRGGLLIHPYIGGMLDEGFEDGQNYIGYAYNDFAALQAAIERCLEMPQAERERITTNAIRLVKNNHVYTKRMRRVIKEAIGE